MAFEFERSEHRGVAVAEFAFDGDLVSAGFHALFGAEGAGGIHRRARDRDATTGSRNGVASDSGSNWHGIDPLALTATGTTRIT